MTIRMTPEDANKYDIARAIFWIVVIVILVCVGISSLFSSVNSYLSNIDPNLPALLFFCSCCLIFILTMVLLIVWLVRKTKKMQYSDISKV
jgi:uncharacterized Tic20 family protein